MIALRDFGLHVGREKNKEIMFVFVVTTGVAVQVVVGKYHTHTRMHARTSKEAATTATNTHELSSGYGKQRFLPIFK